MDPNALRMNRHKSETLEGDFTVGPFNHIASKFHDSKW